MDSTLLASQLLFTGALAGLCWTVQLAVYALFAPLIRNLGAHAFRAHHATYMGAMGWVAAPLMLIELTLAIAWVWIASDSIPAQIGLGLATAIWLLTFTAIVPAHTRLQRSPAESDARRLTRLNWLRTALWTARAALLAFAAIPG